MDLLTDQTFLVRYRIAADGEAMAERRAREIAVEQTIEFPPECVREQWILDRVVGRVEAITPYENAEPVPSPPPAGERVRVRGEDGTAWLATIAYAVETVGNDPVQFLNVLFGNSSLQPGIRVEGIELPDSMAAAFGGPRFGVAGLRERLGVSDGPLFCTALKPMGLSASELAERARAFALGGIEIIKDDHGLADQPFAPFAERVARCAGAVERANRETGRNAAYAPNVSAPFAEFRERVRIAVEAGAGALMVAPGLIGFDAMRWLAGPDGPGLPILGHPSLVGGFVAGGASHGIAHGTLFGTLMRLFGADVTIFPNWGGRFAFTREDCAGIARDCAAPLGPIRPILPAPGGGMDPERLADLRDLYGDDCVILIGGALHRDGPDLTASARRLRERVKAVRRSV